MSLINYQWTVTQHARPKSGLHFDFGFLRHFVGVFALSFSAGVWYAILHFAFHIV